VYTAASGSGKANETVGYTYTGLGQPLTVSDSADTTTADSTGTTTDHYDAEGDLIEVDSPQGTIDYGYDLATGEHTSTTTANTSIAYGYDDQGRLITTTVSELNGAPLSTPLVTTDTYDAVGNKATETLPNGDVTTYTYDALNRLTNLSTQLNDATLFSQTYILNDNGTRASVHEVQAQPYGNAVTSDTSWTYDADGRLTGEAVTSSNYNGNFTDTYSYDLAGNRVTWVHTGNVNNIPNGTTTYIYNGDDELTSQTIGSSTTTYTYDANGSERTSTNGSNVTTYTYDVRNKMVGAAAGYSTSTYVYDDAGNRVAETVSQYGTAVTTYYLTDTNNPTGYAQPVEEHQGSTGGTPSRTYFIGDRAFGQSDGQDNASYLLTDGHGSTRVMTSASGAITATFAYDAFGGAIGFGASTAGTIFLFGGDAVYDPASGLYFHGDGTRDTSGFRFIQADTQGNSSSSDPISLHKYLYADGDPVNGWDPTGHDDDTLADEAFGLVSQIQLQQSLGLNILGTSAPAGPSQTQGGPDITAQLTGIGNFFSDNASLVPPLPIGDVSWDIQQLGVWGHPLNTGPTQTVTVGGGVFYPADVNYFLWGVWGHADGDSQAYLDSAVWAHRFQQNFAPTGTTFGRIDWTNIGYNFWASRSLNNIYPFGSLSGYAPGTPYPGTLYFQVAASTLFGTVLPNGFVFGTRKY
jgi:RHS repeat-associated protein